MLHNRYDGLDTWKLRKGNLHVHSTRSDGGKTYDELVALYRAAGHDFLAFTDHMVFADAGRLSTPGFLCIEGIEIHGEARDGTGAHAIAVAPERPIRAPKDFDSGLDEAADAGAFIALAHPHWCGNSFGILDDPRFHALEVYNEVCEDICAKGTSADYWDWALSQGRTLLGVAVDDAHLGGPYQRYARAWIKIKADSLTSHEIAGSLRAGLFYASNGPDFLDIRRQGNELVVRTSPVVALCAVGRNGKGSRDRSLPPDAPITEAHINVAGWNADDPADYLRLEIVDERGRRAWTNPL